jgi:Xaa-Pro aminopeptidase
MFPAKVYIERRERLTGSLDAGLILLLGNSESPRNYAHNTFCFRQDSTFLYFLGLSTPGLTALIDVDTRRTEIFGVDPPEDEVVWTGPRIPLSEQAARAGVTTVGTPEELADRLEQAGKSDRPVHCLPPYSADHRLRLASLLGGPNPAGSDLGHRTRDLEGADPAAHEAFSLSLVRAVVAQRAYKGDIEIEEIERAIDITVKMQEAAAATLAADVSEARIAAAIAEVAISQEADLAFPTIATVRGEILHNGFTGRRVEDGQLLLVDIGAEVASGYSADITRTFPVSARFTSRQKDVYHIVQQAFAASVAMLAPGVSFLDIHLAACRKLTQGLKDLGLMRGVVDDAVASGAHALFFPCGVGHMLGMDAHDMENLGEDIVGYDGRERSDQFGLSALRLVRPLEPRFVVTVEPGVYFNNFLVDRWRGRGLHRDFICYDRLEPYREFGGCRIEDDYLITTGGARRLGANLATTVSEIEALVGAPKM